MARIRHIAYRADDVEAMADFFIKGLGLEVVMRRSNGAIDLTDGSLNVTVLPSELVGAAGGRSGTGIDHIGVTVDDEAATTGALTEAGASERNPVNLGEVYFERKFDGPEGIIVDVGHWQGALPIDAAPAATYSAT